MLKNLVLIINARQDFIRHSGEYQKKNASILNTLFESISDTYIPLLNMFESLERDEITCRLGLVLPPVLCNLLSDEKIHQLYIQWLENKIELGKQEKLRNEQNQKIAALVDGEIQRLSQLKNDFAEKYQCNLIKAFSDSMHKGYVELLATCGTDIFMPYYSDMKEIISAQIETGLHSYKEFFGEVPEGFWIPELGFFPGVEKLIRAYGYSYTVLETRSMLLAEEVPSVGIFYPVRSENSLVLFGRDAESDDEIFSEDGFINNSIYRNENADIGFNLDMNALQPFMAEDSVRYTTGFKYWNKDYTDPSDYSEDEVYDEEAAKLQAMKDAEAFVTAKMTRLEKAAELLSDKDFVSLVCTLDADKLRQNWHEAIFWLESVFRCSEKQSLNITTCDRLLENQYSLDKFLPYYSSVQGTGYGETLLSSKNCWMMRHIKKACQRMIDLSDRFPTDTGLKNRLLNLGAKELMIAQSLNLAKAIENDENPEYTVRRFKASIDAFTAVFDSLGSNTVSTEWLTNLEVEDSIFPWMNYRIFAQKR